MMIDFARPWVLLLIPMVLFAEWRWVRGRKPEAREILPGRSRGLMDGRARLLSGLSGPLRTGVLLALGAALAGPGIRRPSMVGSTEGPSIVAAVDVSGSMVITNMGGRPRLRVAKDELRRFVKGLPGHPVGLVSFSGEAVTRVPLTTRHNHLLKALDRLQGSDEDDGTALGEAAGVAANRLRNIPARSQIVVLLTDGANNTGVVDPLSAARAAGGVGVRIFSIDVGPASGEAGSAEELLSEMAELSGGRYYRAGDQQGLKEVFREIGEMETSPLTAGSYAVEPVHGGFLLLAALFLLGESLLRLSRMERLS